MKFAAIADVHGNFIALEAVLADISASGITEVVNLGGHVSGPLEARRTADLLIERGFLCIRGDQDRRLVELDQTGSCNRIDYKQLDRKQLDWLANLPPTMVYRDEVFLCHGSPRADTTYWLDRVTDDGSIQATPVEDVEPEAAGIAASLILCGHTHIPRVARLRDGRFVVNAGSVGQPRDGDWRAAYSIYLPDDSLVEQRRVAYEIDRTRKKVLAAGLPRLLADRLTLGR